MKTFLHGDRRRIILFAVWGTLILLDIAGLLWNIVQFRAGAVGEHAFRYSVLHFFVSIFTISAVFLAEALLRFRVGIPLAVCCALFAFFGNTVSNVWRMYDIFPDWDRVLHSLSGVLFAAVGLGLASLFLRDQAEGSRKVFAAVLFALFFSLTVGYLWEIFEFTMDTIDPALNSQSWADDILAANPDGTYLVSSRRGSAIVDTMLDMILHLAGSLVLLIPLTVLFVKKPVSMRAFAFTPVPRKTLGKDVPSAQDGTKNRDTDA